MSKLLLKKKSQYILPNQIPEFNSPVVEHLKAHN